MELIQAFIKSARISGVRLHFSNLDDKTCNLFCLDKESKTIDCNESEAKTFGVKKIEDLIGSTAFDFLPNNIASIYRENDLRIMDKHEGSMLNEPIILPNRKQVSTFTCKVPLFNACRKSEKLIGVIGFSIIIDSDWSQFIASSTDDKKVLTERQLDCLFYLTKGMKIKQIASLLKLSPRTVEHYIETIKIKLNCYDRYELITMALSMYEIKYRELRFDCI